MTWIKLDDTLPDHDRAVRAGDRAMWLWVTGLCWCSRHLTDGRIPIEVVPRLTGAPDVLDLAQVLVDVGLWSKSKKGFVVKKYATFQRTKDEVEKERAGARDRAKRHRASRSRNGVTNGVVTEPERGSRETDSPQTPQGASDPWCSECRNTRLVPNPEDRHGTVPCPSCRPAPPLYAVEGM